MHRYSIVSYIRAFMLVLLVALFPATASFAQNAPASPSDGAQTLQDILDRQADIPVDANDARRMQLGNADVAAPTSDSLGTLGGASDADLWRAYRFGDADITVSSRTAAADVVMQDSGMKFLSFREGPLRTYGGYLLLGMLALLLLFYIFRGKIRIDGEKTGITIERFKPLERFGHWLLASSFIVLAITGLASLFGRVALIPLFGHEAFASFAIVGKWIHNNVSWAFILALVWIFLFWVLHNLPSRSDINWILKGGGLLTKGSHPPAKKFNAGQKLIFWSVIILGSSIALSGLSLLFPFELPLFAKTFGILNNFGFNLPTDLLPHEEMQLALLWHAIVSFVLMAIIIAHIYIGSVGMEGAYDAMGSGQVEKQWAKEHHSLWLDDVEAKEKAATPAE